MAERKSSSGDSDSDIAFCRISSVLFSCPLSLLMSVKFLVILSSAFPFFHFFFLCCAPLTESSTVQVRLLHQLKKLLKVALSLALAFWLPRKVAGPVRARCSCEQEKAGLLSFQSSITEVLLSPFSLEKCFSDSDSGTRQEFQKNWFKHQFLELMHVLLDLLKWDSPI